MPDNKDRPDTKQEETETTAPDFDAPPPEIEWIKNGIDLNEEKKRKRHPEGGGVKY